MAKWLAAMDQEGTLCKVLVGSLDRAYRAARAIQDSHPRVFERVHQLYTDAHRYSGDVPLSHRQFKKQRLSAP